ncbi:MAG: protein kinase [Acidobacteriota bacterium]
MEIEASGGVAKILDFGLAKLLSEPRQAAEATGGPASECPAELTITQPGTCLGTAPYMSPEQIRGEAIDARSDLFSLGATLYQAATGAPPFQGGTRAEVAQAILNEPPVAPRQLKAALSRELERIVLKALEKDRAQRYQSAAEFKADLERLRREDLAPRAGLLASPRRWAVVALAVLAAVIGVTLWMLRGPEPAPAVPLKAVLLTSYQGMESIPSFSPDGSQVAFQWADEGDNWDIYVKSIGIEKPLRLTSGPGASTSPAWSPDGRFIAFLRQLNDRTFGCFLIPPSGGGERKVAELEGVVIPGIYRATAWFPDGRRLLVGSYGSGGIGGSAKGLRLLSIVSGTWELLTEPDRGADLGPAISADGRSIAFSRLYDYAQSELYVLGAPGPGEGPSPPRRVNLERHSAEDPVWTATGRDLIFSSGEFPLAILWRMPPAKPSQIRTLGLAVQRGHSPAISPAANRLVYVKAETDENIWRIELSAPGVPAGPPVKLLASTECDLSPDHSPDGARIAFESCRSGTREIWVADAGGSDALQLTSHGTRPHDPLWSPDGTRIAYTCPVDAVDEVFVVSASGGNPRRLAAHSASDRAFGWSADGKRVYFTSDRGGRLRTWSVAVESGEAALEREGPAGQMSADGRTLYYVERGTNTVWKKPIAGGEAVMVLGPLSNWVNFRVTPEGIYFIPVRGLDGRHYLKFCGFATKSVRTVAVLPARPSWGISVSPDGRTVLVSLYDREATDLMLVENFQ